MSNSDIIRKFFIQEGYKELLVETVSKRLLWRPDYVFEKNGYKYLVLHKSNNSVPPTYLDRIAKVSNNFVPIILFGQKLLPLTEKEVLTMGISIGYLTKNKISELKIKRRLTKGEIKNEIKKKKLPAIDIFISSKQDIQERTFLEERIEVLRKTETYPFNPPRLIEHDKFALKELYKYIDSVISQCDWIIIVLEDNYSSVVSYEIKTAIKKIEHNNIFMFVKSTAQCEKSWKKELTLIKSLPQKSIKYIPYTSQQDLEVYLTRAIKKRMNEIQKKLGIQIYQ